MAVPTVHTSKGALPLLKDVAQEAKQFLGTLAQSATTYQAGYKCELAVTFGDVTEKCVKNLQPETLVMITNVVNDLADSATFNYGDTQSLLISQHLTDSTYYDPYMASESLIADEGNTSLPAATKDNYFRFSETPRDSDVARVTAWLRSLMQDKVEFASLELDAELVRNIIAVAAAHIKALKKNSHQRATTPVLDVTVLRFPDISAEYFKLFRLRLAVSEAIDVTAIYDTDSEVYQLNGQYYSTKICGLAKGNDADIDAQAYDTLKESAVRFFGYQPAF